MPKYSVCLQGHRTSITMEEEFWIALKKLADKKNLSVAKMIENIDVKRNPKNDKNLSSFIRVYLLSALSDNNS